MKIEPFFEAEARLAVHLVSLFHPLPRDFITRFADDLSWPGITLNEHLDWSESFIAQHLARFDPHRIFQNPAIVWTESMRALLPASTARPPVKFEEPEAKTLGDVIAPWSYGCALEKSRPLASLTLEEAQANLQHIAWPRVMESSSSPWTKAWSLALGPLFEEGHRNVTNFPSAVLRRLYDDVCVPALGDAPLAFLEAFFAREPHYDFCFVGVSDAHGVLPTVDVDVHAFTKLKEGERVAVAVNSYAQGPRRTVPMGDAKVLMKGACLVVDRALQDTFASLVLPPHAFHEVALKPTKKLAGQPVVLRFEAMFHEGEVLAQPYDLLIARRLERGLSIQMPQLVLSRRAMTLLRAQAVPNLTFSPAAVMRFSIAKDADPVAALVAPRALEVAPIVLTNTQEFFATKRARMMAKATALPSTYEPKKGVLGQAEKRLLRVFPEEFASLEDVQKARIKRRGYRLLSPSKMYLLDQHGYELEHPESWGAVAVAENGVGDCLGLLLRKDSDFELGATLHEFMHETGRVKRWPMKL
jgi:hypothetical protein